MVGNNIAVLENGHVVGTLKYLDDYVGFSNDEDLQKGYFFPVHLEQTGTTMTLKKNGAIVPDRQNIAFDPDLILRVTPETTFGIEVDGTALVELSFASATFDHNE